MKHIYKIFLIWILSSTSFAFGGSNFPFYSKHWFGEIPQDQEHAFQSQSLLIYDIFVISFDREKKFSRWVAYSLSPSVVWGFLKAERDYKKDQYLTSQQALTPQDYKGASQFGYDRGHLAPLGSFKGSVFIYQAQYTTNLVPQKRDLNQGPWRVLEEKVRAFVKKGHEVKILTGTLYGEKNYGKNYKKTLPPWPTINGKVEQVPSGFWKIISFKKGSSLHVCSFLMPQDVQSRKTSPKKYRVHLKEIKKHSGLALFKGVSFSIKNECGFLF